MSVIEASLLLASLERELEQSVMVANGSRRYEESCITRTRSSLTTPTIAAGRRGDNVVARNRSRDVVDRHVCCLCARDVLGVSHVTSF